MRAQGFRCVNKTAQFRENEWNTHDWHAWLFATPPALATMGPCLGECKDIRNDNYYVSKDTTNRGLTVVAMTALAISTTRRTWKTRADRTTYSFHGLITSSPCFLGILVLGTQVSPLEMTWNMDDFPAPANMDL